jgi:hypothetical protein
MVDEAAIRLRWDTVDSGLDERGRRLFAAAEARSAGRGGLAIISKITGLARSTISRGKKDLDGHPLPKGRVRPCRERASCALRDRSGLVPALKRLVEPATLVGSFSPSGHSISSHCLAGLPGCWWLDATCTRTRANREDSHSLVPSRHLIVRQAFARSPRARSLTEVAFGASRHPFCGAPPERVPGFHTEPTDGSIPVRRPQGANSSSTE